MKRLAPLVIVTCLVACPAMADMTRTRPMPRPTTTAPQQVTPPNAAPETTTTAETSPAGTSIRPQPRPGDYQAKAEKQGIFAKLFGSKSAKPKKQAPKSYAGAVCQDSGIQGSMIPAIKGKQKGCGVDNPVRVTAIDGVTLTTPATIDCDTARALRKWVTNTAKPAFGGDLVGLRVAAHYVCRGRNRKAGARISEHGKGKAIDISGFKLASGKELSILKDYKSSRGKPIRAAHKGACGTFGTTLGPGSDGYHEDHLHFDTAKYRGGPYCK